MKVGSTLLNFTSKVQTFTTQLYGGPKSELFLKVDSFATVNGKRAHSISKVSEFCLEKMTKTCL